MGLSVIFARGIASEVERRGFDPRELWQHCGIDPARLDDLREVLTLDQAHGLLRDAIALTDDPGLGLAIGGRAPENMLQLYGHLLVAQGTLREAFVTLRRYASLLAEGATWGLVERAELALITYEPALVRADAVRFEVDYSLLMMARIGLHFSPRGPRLVELHLAHQAPSYAARYERNFLCPVRFAMPTNALVFPRELLDLRQPHADGTMRDVLHEAAERLLQERAQSRSVVDSVRAWLSYQRDLSEVDIERIARHVGLSVRTLRRRLGTDGMPLSTLIDEARCRAACRELRRPDSTIRGTAELLGFSEQSAFQRAFKRWTGRTPAEYVRLSASELAAQADEPPRREAHASHRGARTPLESR